MERNVCHCPTNALQQIAAHLTHNTLPLDKLLYIGSELTSYLDTMVNCNRCVATKRKINMLPQTMSRLVEFYEAAHLKATATTTTTDTASSRPVPHGFSDYDGGQSIDLPSTVTVRTPDCRPVSCGMKLGSLAIVGAEARILGQVVLMDACVELHAKMQEWKLAIDESLEKVEEQDDAAICRCLDRLAKLIGLLQFDGHLGQDW